MYRPAPWHFRLHRGRLSVGKDAVYYHIDASRSAEAAMKLFGSVKGTVFLVCDRIRLLVLTGCRRNEILGLRWDDLNFDTGEMRLPDTKTGTRMVPLTPAVARVFDGLARTPGNPWVFPGKRKGARLVNLNDSWDRVRKRAGLEDVRLHDLRRSSATRPYLRAA